MPTPILGKKINKYNKTALTVTMKNLNFTSSHSANLFRIQQYPSVTSDDLVRLDKFAGLPKPLPRPPPPRHPQPTLSPHQWSTQHKVHIHISKDLVQCERAEAHDFTRPAWAHDHNHFVPWANEHAIVVPRVDAQRTVLFSQLCSPALVFILLVSLCPYCLIFSCLTVVSRV